MCPEPGYPHKATGKTATGITDRASIILILQQC